VDSIVLPLPRSQCQQAGSGAFGAAFATNEIMLIVSILRARINDDVRFGKQYFFGFFPDAFQN
jgi:hypothetical protein